MRDAAAHDPGYPGVLFFHQASAAAAEEFFESFWPEARAVSDPNKRFYQAFQVETASLRQIFGPSVWLKALLAARKGNRIRRTVGDPWDMPGLFLVRNGRILWTWRFKHVGDHPDFSQLAALTASQLEN